MPPLDPDELIQSHPVATMMLDQDAVILFVNAAAEQLCNISRSAMIGRVVFDIVAMEQGFRQRVAEAGETAFFAHGSDISTGGGRAILADLQMVPCGGNGHRILTLTPSQNDSELTGGSIGRSGKAAGAAAAMLAHEIKNPLAGIKGAAQLIARNAGAAPERFTDLICTEVDRIAELIDQMEHFSSGQPVPCTPINPHQAIHQALETTRAQSLTTTKLVEDFDPSIPLVLGNHDAMVQILLNLLKNAGEATERQDDGIIRISSAFRNGLSLDNGDGRGRRTLPIEIAVSDNGPGVPEAVRDALFDPFVTSKREGRGLGLALVAKLTRDMGGAVQHSRDAQWTYFRLHLPAAPAGGPDRNVA